MFDSVAPTPAERAATRPGDGLVGADAVMDRAFTVDAPPAAVWPWVVQLGKDRAGWYLPRSVERVLPRGNRAARHLDDRWTTLRVGDVVPDYGGARASFTVADIVDERYLVYSTERHGRTMTWAIVLEPAADGVATRLFFRVRIAPIKHRWLADGPGDTFDAVTIAGLARGLRERLAAR